MAPAQTNDGPDSGSLSISPSVVVGIVIVAAFFCCIIFASVYRFCGRRGKENSLTSDAFAARDADGTIFDPNVELWAPNRSRSAAQTDRMKEVRWINNMYAWERGRHARLETGELRPTTMIVGRKGESRSWDEYTVGEDGPGQDGSGNTSGDYPGSQYLYDADNTYGRFSSQQRLSHLAPPSNRGRASYMSTGTNNGCLPRQSSALLPPPIHENEVTAGPVTRHSPLRNKYQADRRRQEPMPYPEERVQPNLQMVQQELQAVPNQHSTPNPRITFNDQAQESTQTRSPFDSHANYETISLDNESDDTEDQTRGRTDSDKTRCNNSRSEEGPFADPAQSPNVIVTDGSLPQLQLQFAIPPFEAHHSVSVYDGDDGVTVTGPTEQQPSNFARNFQEHERIERQAAHNGDNVDSMEEHGGEVGGEIPKENVKT